jgi:hypothetical protein
VTVGHNPDPYSSTRRAAGVPVPLPFLISQMM